MRRQGKKREGEMGEGRVGVYVHCFGRHGGGVGEGREGVEGWNVGDT